MNEREDFVTNLVKLFELASPEGERELMINRLISTKKKEEDLQFLEDHRGPRDGWIAGRDPIFDQGVQRK